MDTEYNQNKNSKKGLFFLVLLVGFSMLVLKITKVNDIQLFKGSSESVICANQVVDQGYDNSLSSIQSTRGLFSGESSSKNETPSTLETHKNNVPSLMSRCHQRSVLTVLMRISSW